MLPLWEAPASEAIPSSDSGAEPRETEARLEARREKRQGESEDGGQTDGEGRRADTALQREEDKEGSRVITRMEVKERDPQAEIVTWAREEEER